jgi:hypothetical protein
MNTVPNEELKRFWEWCGAIIGTSHNAQGRNIRVEFPDGCVFFVCDLSELLTLDNLFKYAVPKLKESKTWLKISLDWDEKGWRCELQYIFNTLTGNGSSWSITPKYYNNPVEALYKAIQEVINEHSTTN